MSLILFFHNEWRTTMKARKLDNCRERQRPMLNAPKMGAARRFPVLAPSIERKPISITTWVVTHTTVELSGCSLKP